MKEKSLLVLLVNDDTRFQMTVDWLLIDEITDHLDSSVLDLEQNAVKRG